MKTIKVSITDFFVAPFIFAPSGVAASYLNVTPQRLKQIVDNGDLEEVLLTGPLKGHTKPRRWRGFRIKDLKTLKEQREGWPSKNLPILRKRLAEVAKGGAPVHYREAMAWVGMVTTNPRQRYQFGALLGRLSEESWNDKKRRFMISALVVRSAGERPNPVFYTFARDLGALRSATYQAREAFFQEQLTKIVRFYRRKPA